MMKRFLIIPVLMIGFNSLIAQGFSGSIEFKYSTPKDTTLNIYWVKDNLVKLDHMTKNGQEIEGSFIFNNEANQIKFLSPKRKLWGNQKSETNYIMRGQCVSTKGTNTRKVAGYTCKEYIVKNTEENTIVTYWIAEGGFDFFIKVLKLWNRKDKQSVYYTQIKNLAAGSMPMLSEEKTISDGKIVSKLESITVTKKVLPASTFEIPAGYNKFE